MKQTNKLLKSTKKKFLIYSTIGITLVAFVSYMALMLHMKNVQKQSSIQKMYSMITRQLTLVSKISLLSETFDENDFNQKNGEPQKEFKSLLLELDQENTSLNAWLAENEFTTIHNMEELLKNNEVKGKMVLFINRARDLINNDNLTYFEIQKSIEFLSSSSRDGLGDVLSFVSLKLQKEQVESLSLLNRMGFALVGLCILQVVLVWLLVFKPLYNTIMAQHHKITEAMLKAESASRSKTDFLANISHEIRTPMTAIIGYADILKRDHISVEEKGDAVKVIEQNASHLLGLIDEILDISKIEAGKFDFESEEVDLSLFLNEVYSLINVKSEEKGIELVFKNKGRIPVKIMADPKRLKQILFNLIGNAIKFTEEGFVELTVSFLEKKNELSFIVKDSGIGISSKQQKKLFNPFEQADTSVARRFGGTGLGLVLSKGLALGMGGNVKIIESKLGVGTSMQVLIDIGKPEKLELVSTFSTNIVVDKKECEISKTELENTKILVVDDAKENARLFKLYLCEAGAEVEIANDGESALKLARNTYFDLVLLDLQMPGKDGFQVIKELRENSFDKPVVALTAHAMKEEKVKTHNAGFDAHITKPVKPEDLIYSISKLTQSDSIRLS